MSLGLKASSGFVAKRMRSTVLPVRAKPKRLVRPSPSFACTPEPWMIDCRPTRKTPIGVAMCAYSFRTRTCSCSHRVYPYDVESSGSPSLASATQGRVLFGFFAEALMPMLELGVPPNSPLSPQSTPSSTSAEKWMRILSW